MIFYCFRGEIKWKRSVWPEIYQPNISVMLYLMFCLTMLPNFRFCFFFWILNLKLACSCKVCWDFILFLTGWFPFSILLIYKLQILDIGKILLGNSKQIPIFWESKNPTYAASSFSSHTHASKSRWLVGSSSNSNEGFRYNARANAIRIRQPPKIHSTCPLSEYKTRF